VRIIFEGFWLEPREFTVNVRAKERRDYKKDSNFFVRSLQEVAENISNILVEVMDFVKAISRLGVNDDEYHLLHPLFNRVLQAVTSFKDDKELK
jgi:hypothetical protein